MEIFGLCIALSCQQYPSLNMCLMQNFSSLPCIISNSISWFHFTNCLYNWKWFFFQRIANLTNDIKLHYMYLNYQQRENLHINKDDRVPIFIKSTVNIQTRAKFCRKKAKKMLSARMYICVNLTRERVGVNEYLSSSRYKRSPFLKLKSSSALASQSYKARRDDLQDTAAKQCQREITSMRNKDKEQS